jgi:hypothetical protein
MKEEVKENAIPEVSSPEFVTFVGWYMSMGEVQQIVGKEGLIIKIGEVTKVKNGVVFYRLDGETSDRKCSEKFIDKVRDFGTSIYGVFYSIVDKNELIDTIIEKLEERVLGCLQAKASLICEMENRR